MTKHFELCLWGLSYYGELVPNPNYQGRPGASSVYGIWLAQPIPTQSSIWWELMNGHWQYTTAINSLKSSFALPSKWCANQHQTENHRKPAIGHVVKRLGLLFAASSSQKPAQSRQPCFIFTKSRLSQSRQIRKFRSKAFWVYRPLEVCCRSIFQAETPLTDLKSHFHLGEWDPNKFTPCRWECHMGRYCTCPPSLTQGIDRSTRFCPKVKWKAT